MHYYKAHIGHMYNRNVCYALFDLHGALLPALLTQPVHGRYYSANRTIKVQSSKITSS